MFCTFGSESMANELKKGVITTDHRRHILLCCIICLFQYIFLYSYEADFIQSLLSTGKKHLASRFNLTYRYIDDVLSINNPEFENYLGQMYPAELEIKDTTESTTYASYLDLLLSIGKDGQLHTSIYDKRDDFNFHITSFPFLSSTVNVVIFAGGKFRENVDKTFHVGVIFTILLIFPS